MNALLIRLAKKARLENSLKIGFGGDSVDLSQI
jgi:hypothetical protein